MPTSAGSGRGVVGADPAGDIGDCRSEGDARPALGRLLRGVQRGAHRVDRGEWIVDVDEVDAGGEERAQHEQRVEVAVPQPDGTGQHAAHRQPAVEALR